jgi:hypothetical protein
MPTMYAPTASVGAAVQTANGNSYLCDANGFIANVLPKDVTALEGAGFVTVSTPRTPNANAYLGKLANANMNVTTDQAIVLSMFGLAPALTGVIINRIVIANANVSLTTAAGGFYSAAAKGGLAIVAAGQVYSGLTAANLSIEATIAVRLTQTTQAPVLFFSLTTAQGAPATADIYVFGNVLGS